MAIRNLLFCLLIAFSAACTSTQPVFKIGLIAPFEGLYRQQGYEALAAMRAAIAETETNLTILPLALDISNASQAERTVAKLLADPTVKALLGPTTPNLAALVQEEIQQADLPWYVPFAPLDRSTEDAGWLVNLLEATVQVGQAQEKSRIALAGGKELLLPQLHDTLVPLVRVTEVNELEPDDLVLWLGDGADGAAFLASLRHHHPEMPFWLGGVGNDPIFYQHGLTFTQETGLALGPVYWAAWLDQGYAEWATTHSPNSALAYQVFRDTQTAIAHLSGMPPPSSTWTLHLFQYETDGSSQFVAEFNTMLR